MHMSDALIVPAVAGTMYLASAVTAGTSIHRVRLENDPKKIPTMGVMGAFVFATQMINFTIPGTGSSGHLCGGLLLTALLGPWAAFLTMIGVLLVQCLFFADGGLLALGCNIWNMAFYGCFVGGLLIWRPIMKNGIDKKKIIIASIIGNIISLQLGAFSVTLETLISGITELPFTAFLAAMQPIHFAIGFVEGLITAAVLCFVHQVQPDLLWGADQEKAANKWSLKQTMITLGVVALAIGGGLSLLASGYPDGLEWSMEKVAGTAELEAAGGVYDTMAGVQDSLAFLPDYAFAGSDSMAGTTVSGLVGAVIVAALCAGVAYLLKLTRRKVKA